MNPNYFRRNQHSFETINPDLRFDRSQWLQRGFRGESGGRGQRDGGRSRGFGGGNGNFRMMKRLLAHGDLKLLALLLIEEKPRHGYELIKLIESKSSQQYAPSPGVIYPTLTYLEEVSFVKVENESDKKQYSITEDGKKYLEENREIAVATLKQLEEMGARIASVKSENNDLSEIEESDIFEIRNAVHAIKFELRSSPKKTKQNKKDILEILDRALLEIKALKDGGAQ